MQRKKKLDEKDENQREASPLWINLFRRREMNCVYQSNEWKANVAGNGNDDSDEFMI